MGYAREAARFASLIVKILNGSSSKAIWFLNKATPCLKQLRRLSELVQKKEFIKKLVSWSDEDCECVSRIIGETIFEHGGVAGNLGKLIVQYASLSPLTTADLKNLANF